MIEITSEQPRNRSRYKRYCWILCATLVYLFTTTTGYTAVSEHTLQINFFFDTEAVPDKQVTGYRLYMEGDPVCETTQVEPQIQSINCSVISEDGTHTFTLSALYDDNSVSPQSNPFLFTLVLKGDINGDGLIDLKDVIIGLQVLMNLTPSELVKAGDVNNDGKIGLEEVLYCLKKV